MVTAISSISEAAMNDRSVPIPECGDPDASSGEYSAFGSVTMRGHVDPCQPVASSLAPVSVVAESVPLLDLHAVEKWLNLISPPDAKLEYFDLKLGRY